MQRFWITPFAIALLLATLVHQPAPAQTDRNTLALYDLLLREIAHYHNRADIRRQQGKPDAFMRKYHKTVLDLTDERNEQLAQLARRYTQNI